MNEDPDGLDCPICFSPIIGPHSINCGHTICYDCFNRLRDTKCPVCRYDFKSKDKAGVNILLDKLLLERIDNYQGLRDTQEIEVRSARMLERYGKSTRYHDNKKTIRTFLEEQQNACKLSLIMECDIPEIEIKYIIDRSQSITLLTINESDYIVNLETSSRCVQAVDKLKDIITPSDIIYLLTVYDQDLVPIAENLGVSAKRTLLEDTKLLSDYLTTENISLTERNRHSRSDTWETDSGDDVFIVGEFLDDASSTSAVENVYQGINVL